MNKYAALCFNRYISLNITLLCKHVISTNIGTIFVHQEYSALVNVEAPQ